MDAASPTIAHVLHRLDYAGAEVLAAAMARRLRQRYRFLFVCLDGCGPLGESLRRDGFPIEVLQRRPGIDWAAARWLGEICREHRVDLLHAHQYSPFFYAAIGRSMSGRGVGLTGRWRASADAGPSMPRLLFTEHGRHFPDRRRIKRVLANRLLLRSDDRVTAVGEVVRRALAANEGIVAGRVEVIYNGIDAEALALQATPEARAAVRRELGLAHDQPVLLQVARFHPVKDHATSLTAFAAVAREQPSAVLLLAGDGERRPHMEALARGLGVARQVRFLGVRTDVPRLMAAADASVLSSASEGISVTLLEAMACRLPIAATDVGGNAEVVEDGVTGLLSPRGDAAALAQSLRTLLAYPPLRRRFGDSGRARVIARFSAERMHRTYGRLYEEMLAPAAPAAASLAME